MLRESFKKIFGSRAFYIIFSILASLTLWLYIQYNENSDISITVSGIRVEYVGKELLEDRELILTETSVDTVNIVFSGSRSDVRRLTNKNVTVTVDLSNISVAREHVLNYEINLPEEPDTMAVNVSSLSVDYISVTVEKLLSKSVQVMGAYNGGTPDGYMVGTLQYSPETVTVSGPERVVGTIDRAWVSVPRENLSKTITEEFPFIWQDKDRNEVVSSYLRCDHTAVTVTVPILVVKELQLKVTLSPGAGATEDNTEVIVTPSTITLSGDAGVLSDYNSIPLGTIDLTKFDTSTTQTLPIIIPDGTTSLTGETEATVQVIIHGLEVRTITTDNITITNVPDGLVAETLTLQLPVTVRGRAAALDSISAANVRIVGDVSQLQEDGSEIDAGIYTLTARVSVDSEYAELGALGEYKVTFRLVDEEDAVQGGVPAA